jgi:hypothetical protein
MKQYADGSTTIVEAKSRQDRLYDEMTIGKYAGWSEESMRAVIKEKVPK